MTIIWYAAVVVGSLAAIAALCSAAVALVAAFADLLEYHAEQYRQHIYRED